jgi:hypothetical protein
MDVRGELVAPASLPPGEISQVHWIEGSVDSRGGLEAVNKRRVKPGPSSPLAIAIPNELIPIPAILLRNTKNVYIEFKN